MLVTLKTRGFRNLQPLDFSPGAGSHLLLGDNGAGKTSVLEAVYLLATTRSFRTSQVAECARHGAAHFHLEGEVEDRSRVRLEVGWSETAEGGRRHRAVNGNDTTLAEHLEVLPVVAWTAAEAEILTGAPALRRRLMDRGVVATRPGVLEELTRYRRTLGQKRELLASGRADRGARGSAELETWNALLAAAAARVMTLRHAYVRRLEARLREVWGEADLPFPEVRLIYRPSPALRLPEETPPAPGEKGGSTGDGAGPEGALPEGGEPVPSAVEAGPPSPEAPGPPSLEAAILERLERSAGAEIRRGTPLLGPHRDDLEISWGGHPVRATVSAGERKSLSLLVTAAHGRALAAAGRSPVYLLDDLDAELAPGTLARVWQVFAGSRQLLATSNRPAVWEGLAVDHRSRLTRGALSRDAG